jgi:hypothetical protein
MTRIVDAVINVDLTQVSHGAMGTRALEIIDEV